MEEQEGIGAKGLKTKLIINYLPQAMTDDEFKKLFESMGPLDSYRVMRDRSTNYSFGYGFVDYQKADDAQSALEKLHGYEIAHKTLRVAYSKPVGSSKNTNLHVTGLGTHIDETKLQELFAPHGEIVQVKILKNADNSSKGAGFVLFKDKREADASIRALQGYADGYGMNMQIHYAKDNTEQQKQHPKFQEYLSTKYTDPQQQQFQVYGGNVPGYQNYAGQNYGQNTYGGGYGGGVQMDYNMQQAQKAGGGRGNNTRFNPIARPMGAGGGMAGGGMAGSSMVQPIVLYCYNIGPNATEADLYQLFGRFGRIVKVNVITGKGFGFVHMPIPNEAQEAVNNLNGMFYQGKTLQVSVKTNKST